MFKQLANGSPVTAPVQIMPLHLVPFPCLQAIASVTSISFHLVSSRSGGKKSRRKNLINECGDNVCFRTETNSDFSRVNY